MSTTPFADPASAQSADALAAAAQGNSSQLPQPAPGPAPMSQSPTAQAVGNTPQAPAAPPPQQPFWKTLLQGALQGLAGARGATHFGGGAAGGAANVLAETQQDKENAFRQQQLDQSNAANQANIRFRDLDSALAAKNLTTQGLEQQKLQGELRDNEQARMDKLMAFNMRMGKLYDALPTTQYAIANHLAQRTANGAAQGGADVPDGVIMGPNTTYVPKSGQNPIESDYQLYQTMRPVLGLPDVGHDKFVGMDDKSRRATMEPVKNQQQGLDPQRKYLSPPQLDAAIGSLQFRMQRMQEDPTTTPDQTEAAQTLLDTYKAQKQQHTNANTQKAALTVQAHNAMAQGTGLGGGSGAPAPDGTYNGPRWLPKVTADEKKKAELAENIAFNANEVNGILARRPDLVGKAAGRFTNVQQMIGNDDPDISAVGNHIHNIAMANSGVHGFRNQQGVKETETNLLNNFHNGTNAVAGAMNANTSSVQTFIDNARPNGYPTHSSQGGAAAFYSGQKAPQQNGNQTPNKPAQGGGDFFSNFGGKARKGH